ncbi:hypothetical protein M409DRAFT_71460 [Zasmidium cellare ATCC 36951]|uniref:Thioesterase domain-containing protein n=1 Tax=Zasmidium cellare ATCC 36951 TaxID=1080233 RepID=A0A6A6BVN8_ZASCE|nr:uncharacterized protein M409DRAFT_71460 [Zasmidium cellare ATCC 36951]KAF2158841.1 hypothetical protein M409DRAFT_71460 [Zasmidium cellare ATCC 36951]
MSSNSNPPSSSVKHANTAPTHPDFQLPWTQAILTDPETKIYMPTSWQSNQVNNRFIAETLSSPTALKAHIFLRRPCAEPTSLSKTEDVYLLSIGPGLDGAAGRAHGGFNSLILDHITGTCAHREGGGTDPPPATAYLNVQYKAPVGTPAVLMARAWAERVEGRKVFVRGLLEDGEGGVYASAEALFVTPREGVNGVKL